MPELPEVESLRRSLIPKIINQKIKKVEILMPKLIWSNGTKRSENKEKVAEFISGLEGQSIIDLKRRAKNLIFEISNGARLLVHLKMTGQFAFVGNGDMVWGGHPIEISEKILPNKHTYLIFHLGNGTLYYNDVRQFGYLLFFKTEAEMLSKEHFSGLGLEPLDAEFNSEYFSKKLKNVKTPIKKLLLDQKIVVGVGNIYADESLFRSKILPFRTAESLKSSEIKLLTQNIKNILVEAIDLGGSSVANYIMADGSRGTFAKKHMVYGRAGKPCLVCGKDLSKTIIGSRTTVYCTKCQK